MSEGLRPLPSWLLLAELALGIGFGVAVAAYCTNIPASVNLGMSLPAVVASRLAFFALVVATFNISMNEVRRGRRTRGMALLLIDVCLVPILLMISFPQY